MYHAKKVGFMNLTQDEENEGGGEVKQYNIDNGKLMDERVTMITCYSGHVVGVKQGGTNIIREIGPQAYPVFLKKKQFIQEYLQVQLQVHPFHPPLPHHNSIHTLIHQIVLHDHTNNTPKCLICLV